MMPLFNSDSIRLVQLFVVPRLGGLFPVQHQKAPLMRLLMYCYSMLRRCLCNALTVFIVFFVISGRTPEGVTTSMTEIDSPFTRNSYHCTRRDEALLKHNAGSEGMSLLFQSRRSPTDIDPDARKRQLLRSSTHRRSEEPGFSLV
ncbi:hypothetical protein JXQ70_01820 [bacterium]|nr:hypothetical protein [bacterium]